MTMEGSAQGPGPATPQPPPSSPPPPPPAGGKVSDNRSVMIVLSYLGLLALIPLLVEKEDREVQWHAKHGLVLAVFWIVLFIALQIVGMILGAITGGLGCLIAILFPVLSIAILVIHIMCIVKGLKGERFMIPGISEFANRF
jgi:uncharacterized membrane protein